MSNILVCKNYNITDHTKWYDDRTNENNLVNNYTEMEKICIASAEEHLQDLDEVKVFRGEADNIRDVFKKNFYEIYDLWKEGHNILYVDLDVVFMKPVAFFDQFDKFSMFNLTDPPKTSDDHYNVNFDFYFNCGVRYYPKDMNQEVWDLGIKMMENWNPDRWDSEQIVYNAMMWSQDGIEPGQVYNPKAAYQMLFDFRSSQSSINTQFNQMDFQEAHVIHVHGSRGSANRLDLMQTLLDGNFESNTEEVLYL